MRRLAFLLFVQLIWTPQIVAESKAPTDAAVVYHGKGPNPQATSSAGPYDASGYWSASITDTAGNTQNFEFSAALFPGQANRHALFIEDVEKRSGHAMFFDDAAWVHFFAGAEWIRGKLDRNGTTDDFAGQLLGEQSANTYEVRITLARSITPPITFELYKSTFNGMPTVIDGDLYFVEPQSACPSGYMAQHSGSDHVVFEYSRWWTNSDRTSMSGLTSSFPVKLEYGAEARATTYFSRLDDTEPRSLAVDKLVLNYKTQDLSLISFQKKHYSLTFFLPIPGQQTCP